MDVSIGVSPPSSSHDQASTSSQERYTKKEATKMLRNSVRKWSQNERKWNDCMHCQHGMVDIKRADRLENNITKQKDKINHVINNLHNSNISSKNEERRFKYAKKKADDKLDNYSDDRFDRILVRHAKTGVPGPHR